MNNNMPIVEEQKPRRVLIKNDTVLFVVVALGSIGLGTGMSYLCMRFGLPYLWFSIMLYAFFGLVILWLYRSALVTYRFTVSERMLTAVRVIGKKVTPEVQVHLCDIVSVDRYTDRKTDGKVQKVGHGKKRGMLLVRYKTGKANSAAALAVSDGFAEELSKHIKQAKK